MFKRKTTLPARLPIPNKDAIIDDLTQATPDDVVHKIDPKNKIYFSEPKINKHLSDIDEINDFSEDCKDSGPINQLEDLDPSQAYLKVASFVEKMNDLEIFLTELDKNKNNLKNLEESLMADIAKVEEEFKKRSEA